MTLLLVGVKNSPTVFNILTITSVERGSRSWPPVQVNVFTKQLLALDCGYVNLLGLLVCIMLGEGGKRTSNLSLLHILVTLNR